MRQIAAGCPFFCLVIVLATILYSCPALADDTFTPDFHPVLNIESLRGVIEIDGDLSDSGWRNVARVDHFVENNPGDNIRPPVETAALMTYDRSHLYVALIAWDDPSQVRVSMSDRDNIFTDDYIGLMFDTYGDMAWGYEIFVNPLGIQGDLRILSDGNEDMSLDLVFESRGLVTDSGYQVELAIPFASLRFPNKAEQTWRLQFWRDRQRDNRNRYSWAAQDRDNSCWVCQWGTLTGIRDIKPGSNVEILPNVITYQSGAALDDSDPFSNFDNTDPDAEFSVNARYGISSNSSLELAVNPDFSQIESDAGQIDVNQTFALYFPERRPFFQEGSDMLGTWIDVVYTRSINDPSVATKVTGQFGRSSATYLLARDDNAPLTMPFQQQSVGVALENATVNILRARQTFGQNSYVGLMFTDRRTDSFARDGLSHSSGSGTNYGIDSRLRLSNAFQFEFQLVGSYTEEPDAPDLIDTTQEDGTARMYFDRGKHTIALDGESFGGHGMYASFEMDGRKTWFDIDYTDHSPTFRTDVGFTTRNDNRSIDLEGGILFRPNKDWLVQWSPSVGIGRVFDYRSKLNLNPADFDEGVIDEWLRPNLYFQLKGQTNLNLWYLTSRERFNGYLFTGITRAGFNLNSRPTGRIRGGFSASLGRSIYRRRARLYEEIIPEADRETPNDSIRVVDIRPVMGIATNFSAWLDLKLSQRLLVEPNIDFFKLSHRDGYIEANPDADREIYSGYIFRTRLSYQFTRELFLRLVLQYDEFDDFLTVEPLVTYKVNPFTVFYAGMGSGYQSFNASDYEGLNESRWKLTRRQFFAKFQYLFRI